jgi:hypothetical protein
MTFRVKDGLTVNGVEVVNSDRKLSATDLVVDNIQVDGNAIVSTNTNGNITITPNGAGTVAISKLSATGGTVNSVSIGAGTASSGAFTTLTSTSTTTLNGTAIPASKVLIDETHEELNRDLRELRYGVHFAIDQAGLAQKRINDTQTASLTGTVTISSVWPGNDWVTRVSYPTAAVTFPRSMLSTNYTIDIEVVDASVYIGRNSTSPTAASHVHAAHAGEIIVSNRATNGFTLNMTGTAATATVRWRISNVELFSPARSFETTFPSYAYGTGRNPV